MNGGPHWMFAPLGASILLPGADRAAAAARRVRRRSASCAGAVDLAMIGWLGAGARAGLQRRPAAALHASNMSGTRTRAAAASRSTMTARRCPIDAAWERAEMPYTARRRWAAPAPAVAGRRARPSTLIGAAARRRRAPASRLRLAANGAESDRPDRARPSAGCASGRQRRLHAPLRRGADDDVISALRRPRLRRRDARRDDRPAPGRSSSPSSAPAAACPPAAAPLVRARPANGAAAIWPGCRRSRSARLRL